MGCGGSRPDAPDPQTPAPPLPEPEPEPEPNMSEVDLNSQGLTAFPDIGGDKIPLSCTKLEVYANKIKKVPPDIKKLEALEVLNCFNNVIGLSLPDDLGELANLTEVNMAANKLAMLKDPVFKNWSKVEVLNLNDNNLSSMGSFAPMVALKEVRIYGNQLGALPTLAASHPELEIFEAHKNRIEVIEDSFFLAVPALKRLSMWGNQLKTVPDSILKCSTLVGVQLQTNPDLASIPQGTWPSTLETLFIQETKISALPKFTECKGNLKRVNITGVGIDDDLAKSLEAMVLAEAGAIFWDRTGKQTRK